MTDIAFQSNGLGEPLSTEWQAMDVPVGPALFEAGPDGWMEFGVDDDGQQRWRMWRPFDWSVG